jgi:exodeoxyribonuclease VIII
MLRGTLAHCAVLEPHALAERYVVVPADAPRRPTSKQWEAKKPSPESAAAMAWWTDFSARAEGRQIVSAEDYAITQQQLQALADEPTIASILKEGRGEVSVFWRDARTGVYCKARPDWMTPPTGRRVTLLDLKSTADESPSGFGRAAARMKYHLQRSHYVDGVQQATGWRVDEFVFAAVTSAPPVLAVPYFLTDAIKEQADDERAELLDLYARCMESGQWPAYGQGLQMLDFPAYAKRDSEVEVSFAD